MRRIEALAIALVVGVASFAQSQDARPLVIRVHVTDSAGAAVQGAEASLVQGVNEVLVRGSTDGVGRRQLFVNAASGDYQLVIRKVGYSRSDLFFAVTARDTLTFEVVMSRVVQTLDSVTVTAESEIRKRRYHVDADQIENSDRKILDAWDVIEKMRPDMVWGLKGPPDRLSRRGGGRPVTFGTAGPLQNVYVNGIRIFNVPVDAMVRARSTTGVSRVLPLQVKAVLASIHPEHIAEMNYSPAAEGVGMARGNSVFIVLKPGVTFEPGKGTFIDEKVSMTAAEPVVFIGDLPHYRARVVGVFDEQSGDPIANVAVIDTLSGLRSFTTATGTLALVYVPDGNAVLRFESAGYAPKSVTVSISPKDTSSILVTLLKHK